MVQRRGNVPLGIFYPLLAEEENIMLWPSQSVLLQEFFSDEAHLLLY